MKKYSFSCLKIIGVVFETTVFWFTDAPYFDNSLITFSVPLMWSTWDSTTSIRLHAFNRLSCSSLYFTQSHCGDKDCRVVFFLNVAANQVWQRDVLHFLLFSILKVPSMEFALLVEHQPYCVQSYLFETQDLILSGDKPLKPCPCMDEGQGGFFLCNLPTSLPPLQCPAC